MVRPCRPTNVTATGNGAPREASDANVVLARTQVGMIAISIPPRSKDGGVVRLYLPEHLCCRQISRLKWVICRSKRERGALSRAHRTTQKRTRRPLSKCWPGRDSFCLACPIVTAPFTFAPSGICLPQAPGASQCRLDGSVTRLARASRVSYVNMHP